MTFAEELRAMNACEEAVAWVGDKTLQEAWAQCDRAEWMLWYVFHKLPRAMGVLAACACVRTALPFAPAGELRLLSLHAIEAAEGWCRGEVSRDAVRAAAAAAADAARDAAAAHTAYAAYIAARSVYISAGRGDQAAAFAAYAAIAAARAAYDARDDTLREMAHIVRSIISSPTAQIGAAA